MVLGISGIFLWTITGNVKCFQYLNSKINFLKRKPLEKTREQFCSSKYYNWKRKISVQNCPLRSLCFEKKIEWEVQNGPITKNTVLPVTIF